MAPGDARARGAARTRLALAAVLVAAVLPAVGSPLHAQESPDTTGPAAATGTVRGRLTVADPTTSPAGHLVYLADTRLASRTNAAGMWIIPNVPPGSYRVAVVPGHGSLTAYTPPVVEVEAGGEVDVALEVDLSGREQRTLELTVDSVVTDEGVRTLAGTVVTGSRPLSQVEVTLTGIGTKVTGASGDFRFDGVEDRVVIMRSRLLGYEERVDTFFLGGALTHVVVPLAEKPIALEPLKVEVHRTASPMDGFFDRRERGDGVFFTRAQIERASPVVLSDIFRRVAGARLACSGPYCTVTFSRAMASAVTGGCVPTLYLDGALWGDASRLDAELTPADVQAIEVYRGPSELPPRFGGSRGACGAIVVWTGR